MTGIELRSALLASDIPRTPHYEILFLVYKLMQRGQQLADFDYHYRAIVRGSRHPNRPSTSSYTSNRLGELVTLGYAHSLVAHWADTEDLGASRSLPSAMRTVEAFAQEIEDSSRPVSALEKSSRKAARRLLQFAHRVRNSKYYFRLQSHLEEYNDACVAGESSDQSSRAMFLHQGIDRVSIATRCAQQAVLRYMIEPEETGLRPDDYVCRTNHAAASDLIDRLSNSEA